METRQLWETLQGLSSSGTIDDRPLKGSTGVYALYGTNDSPIYVGRTTDLQRRLHDHSKDLTKSLHGWERWQFWACASTDTARLETYLIGLWSPPLNLTDKPMPSETTSARNKVIGWRVSQAEWAAFFPLLETFPQCTFAEAMYWIFDLPCVQEAISQRVNSPLRDRHLRP